MAYEYWLIPKSADLHQSIVFIEGIKKNYNNKKWNSSAQDRLGSYIAKRGATKKGRNVTPQRIRTLMAGIPQYFGFIQIDDGKISVTDAGIKLLDENKAALENYSCKNLSEGISQKKTIEQSEIFLNQFKKIQITNPIINKYSKNIMVMPFYCTLQILNELQYLTEWECGYFLFKIRDHSELNSVIKEIKNFRSKDYDEKNKLIATFKQSDEGRISLVKAPTTKYFFKLLKYTGLFVERSHVEESNELKKYRCLEFNLEKKDTISVMLNDHDTSFIFDYKNDTEIWNQYISNTKINNCPKYSTLKNLSGMKIFVTLTRNKKSALKTSMDIDEEKKLVIFDNLEQQLEVYSINTREKILNEHFTNYFSYKNIVSKNKIQSKERKITNIESEILAHIDSKNFSSSYLKELDFLENNLNKSLKSNKSLRGAKLEHLFFEFLSKFNIKTNLGAEVIWNGKIDKYGLPTPAPGGKKGNSDIVLLFDNYQFVFELTTIKSKSAQEKAEAFAVPDHINNHKREHPKKKTIGFYLAPFIHQRIIENFINYQERWDCKIKSIEIKDFLDALSCINEKDQFINYCTSENN